MSAPLIWIIFPLIVAVLLWFFQKKRYLTLLVSTGLCALLGITAIFQNIDSALHLGSLSISINSTMLVLGRRFVLDNSDRLFIAFIYLALVFWFVGSFVARVPSKFIPLGLAVAALVTASMAVEPFIYSAILIELAVIISLPLIISKDTGVGKGVLRYLIFQSLAMPMILLAGWILSGTQINFTDIHQLYSAAIFLGLGFAFLLGVFPFHFWIPEFCCENDAYINGFVLSIFPIAYILILLDFVNGLAWLKDATFLIPIMQTCGILMIVTGGILAAMQTDLRRIFGYIIILETGFSLVCVSLRNDLGTQLFNYSILSRELEIGLWALALKSLELNHIETDFIHLKGRMKEFPIVAAALIVGLFSSAGLPLLASFPTRAVLLNQLISKPVAVLWILIGMGATFFVGCKLLQLFFPSGQEQWSIKETRSQIVLLVIGVFVLFLIGFFPSVFQKDLLSRFTQFLQ